MQKKLLIHNNKYYIIYRDFGENLDLFLKRCEYILEHLEKEETKEKLKENIKYLEEIIIESRLFINTNFRNMKY
jgi:hypothetical protein